MIPEHRVKKTPSVLTESVQTTSRTPSPSEIIVSNLIEMIQLKPKRKGMLFTFAEPASGRAEIKTQEIKT